MHLTMQSDGGSGIAHEHHRRGVCMRHLVSEGAGSQLGSSRVGEDGGPWLGKAAAMLSDETVKVGLQKHALMVFHILIWPARL